MTHTHARARAHTHTHTHTHGMMPMGWTKQYEFECCFVYVVTTPKVYRVRREVMGGSRARIVRNKKMILCRYHKPLGVFERCCWSRGWSRSPRR